MQIYKVLNGIKVKISGHLNINIPFRAMDAEFKSKFSHFDENYVVKM